MQREFFKILEEQNRAGATVFLSSHILSEVQAHCRTAAFIKDGRIIISDRVERLEETETLSNGIAVTTFVSMGTITLLMMFFMSNV